MKWLTTPGGMGATLEDCWKAAQITAYEYAAKEVHNYPAQEKLLSLAKEIRNKG